MGRTKRKKQQKPKEEKVKILKPEESDDDEVPEAVHANFLENIAQVHGKPKILPATRNVPAAEVSEFSLTTKKPTGKRKRTLQEEDLLRPIQKKKPKVAKKLQAVKKVKTLPKPLETFHEKKVQREVGFESVSKHLDRWDDVVKNNRLADQLRFPLKDKKLEIYDHTDTDLFSSLPNPTPLEQELAEVLNRSEIAQEHSEELEKSKFRLTLKEMIEKRKMFAKIKVQASFKIAKAWRQNKIKSKKYHRILRKEKTKQQVKDFETLQKTDPEEALKQLEQLEKGRAEERATLRHRNTGKWAKNQIIKATYNKESRIALSEQLSKNRELTQKLHPQESDSESENSEPDIIESANVTAGKSDNPWISDSKDYAKFVSNYKKFWESKSTDEPTATETVTKSVDVAPTKDPIRKRAKKRAGEKKQKGSSARNMEEVASSSSQSQVAAVNIENDIPDIVTGGDEGLDDEDDNYGLRMTISEAFAEDDVVAEFEEEKEAAIESSQPKKVDLSLPGWGSWTSESIVKKDEAKKRRRPRVNKRLLFKIPKAPPRKDANKGHVIINEEMNNKLKEHMVNELPFPFTAVKDYEASIRAPIGRTWLPETAHQKLITPPVVTKLGMVIDPMDEGELIQREQFEKL